jgi:hypothetical protein
MHHQSISPGGLITCRVFFYFADDRFRIHASSIQRRDRRARVIASLAGVTIISLLVPFFFADMTSESATNLGYPFLPDPVSRAWIKQKKERARREK